MSVIAPNYKNTRETIYERKIKNTIPLHRKFMPKPDGRRLDKELVSKGENKERPLDFYGKIRDEIRTVVEKLSENIGILHMCPKVVGTFLEKSPKTRVQPLKG